jgi:hypothetical protein
VEVDVVRIILEDGRCRRKTCCKTQRSIQTHRAVGQVALTLEIAGHLRASPAAPARDSAGRLAPWLTRLGSLIIHEEHNRSDGLHSGLPVISDVDYFHQTRTACYIAACLLASASAIAKCCRLVVLLAASVRLACSMVLGLALGLGNREVFLGLSVDSGGIHR